MYPARPSRGDSQADQRNESGELLTTFCEAHRLWHTDSQFQKPLPKRWTQGPDGQHKHEHDHILANGRFVTDTRVVSSFNIGSDHRLLPSHLHFDTKYAKYEMVKTRRPLKRELDRTAPKVVPATCTLPVMDASNLNQDYGLLVQTLQDIQSKCVAKPCNHSTKRLTESTRKLMSKRRFTSRTDPTLRSLCEECRRAVENDHDQFAQDQALAAAHQKRSLKRVARDVEEYRSTIPSLKDPKTGERVSSRPKMEYMIKDFYAELLSSRDPVSNLPPRRRHSPVPPFLPSEVRAAVTSFPNGKTAGEDKISADFLKACRIYDSLATRFTAYLDIGEICPLQ